MCFCTTYLQSIRYGVFVLALCWSACAYTQDKPSTALAEVQVHGFAPERFMAGLKVEKMDSATLARFQFQTLADFLQFHSPVSFKSYGAGQLATIAFRGTSANHTAVLWNGLNINQPTLGLTDFSTVPLLGFDEMSIQYGSAASCVGTDAVGGSILLSSAPRWKQKGTHLTAGFQYGSFDNWQAQSGIRFVKFLKNSWQISGKTLLYGSQANNHFSETERTDGVGRVYPLEPSETVQKGFVQDLFLRKKTGNQWSLNIWLSDNKLTIQPKLLDQREITQTKAYRFMTGYQLGNTQMKLGFVKDIIDYGKGDFIKPSHSETDRYIAKAEHEFSWKKENSFNQTFLRIGTEFTHYETRVDGYGDSQIAENRADVFALLRQQLGEKLLLSANLRQALSSQYTVPFTPSLGVEYKIINLEKTQLSLTGNIARSYRLPTLNERYWLKLGKPDIKPEDGFNKEIGLTLKQVQLEYLNTSFGINVYHNLIDNWTYWNPTYQYRVENLLQVLSKGFELNSSIKYLKNNRLAGFSVMYAFTDASQQKSYDVYSADVIGKQLVYVPRHSLSLNTYYGINHWLLSLQGLYNSERFVTFDNSGTPFPAYFLLNATISGKINIGKVQSNLIFQFNNLTDTVYPNVKKNAMPGRSVALGLSFGL